jgi:hypothetical protein
MTEQWEQRLATGFREYAAGVRLDPGVVAAAAARHHRRTVARRAMVGAGVAGVAAALSAVLVLDGAGPPPAVGPRARSSAGAQAPALQLASAVRATARTSFRLRMTVIRSYETGRLKGHSERQEYAGAFDAAADRGYLRIGPSATAMPAELRIIGEDVYLGRPDAKVWSRHIERSRLGDLLGAATPAASAVVRDLSVDPRVMLETLRRLGGVTPAGRHGRGSAAVDTYTFAYQVGADASTAAHRVTGGVEIGADSHLLARITQHTVTVGADPAVADRSPLTWRTDIRFADYGTPVHVAKPALTTN